MCRSQSTSIRQAMKKPSQRSSAAKAIIHQDKEKQRLAQKQIVNGGAPALVLLVLQCLLSESELKIVSFVAQPASKEMLIISISGRLI
jgi:hypothetical protein